MDFDITSLPSWTVAVIATLTAVSIGLMVEPASYFWVKYSRNHLKSILKEFKKISYDLPALEFWLKIWGLSIGCALFLGIVSMKPLLGINVAFILFVIPKQVLIRLLHKRNITLKEQLIGAISMMSNTIKTGMSLEQTFDAAGKELKAPLGDEFRRISYECARGRVFDRVLNDSKSRIQFQEYSIFVTALTTNKQRGGDVTVTLQEIKKSLSENRRLDRKLEADTSSGKMTTNILAATPAAFLALSALMNPAGTGLMFSTLAGQFILLAATIITYAGYIWAQKITGLEF